MVSPLLIVLGISSTLLGLYITILSVINPDTQADFHIGTYLSIDTSRSHSIDLRSRLDRVQMRDQYNRKVDSLIKTTPLIDNDIHSKSLALAHSIQSYIHTLTTTNTYQQSNMEYFTQLSKARKQYTDCASQLSLTINVNQNQHLWQSYQQCFVKYDKEKQLIGNLYNERKRLLKQIDDLMVYDPNANKQFDLDDELKKIKQRYDQENKVNDKNKQNLIIELKRLQQKNQLKTTQYDQSQRQYNRTKIEYEICLKNLKQFRKCQDIAKALRQYGYVETVQSLQDRIKSKREILVKLRQHALQSRQAGGDNRVITEMYAKREKQLIQTIKLRLDMGYDEMKQCGCTQAQRKKLQKQYEESKIKLSLSKKQLNQLTYDIFSYQKKIKQTDKLRQQLINEFREDTQRLKNKQTTNILSLQQKLAIMKQNLQKVNDELSNYSPKMNSIEFLCNQYKSRLGLKLGDGERVSDCLAKKRLYDGLKDKAALIVKEEGTGLIQGKERIRVLLQSVMYPQRLLAITQQPSVFDEKQQQIENDFQLKNNQVNKGKIETDTQMRQQHQQQQHTTPEETIIEVTKQQQLTITHPTENKVIIEHTQRIQVVAQPVVVVNDDNVDEFKESDGLL